MMMDLARIGKVAIACFKISQELSEKSIKPSLKLYN
jgi:hypothetical protein